MKIKYQESPSRLRSIDYVVKRLIVQAQAEIKHDRKHNSYIMTEEEIRRKATETLQKAIGYIAKQVILTDWEH